MEVKQACGEKDPNAWLVYLDNNIGLLKQSRRWSQDKLFLEWAIMDLARPTDCSRLDILNRNLVVIHRKPPLSYQVEDGKLGLSLMWGVSMAQDEKGYIPRHGMEWLDQFTQNQDLMVKTFHSTAVWMNLLGGQVLPRPRKETQAMKAIFSQAVYYWHHETSKYHQIETQMDLPTPNYVEMSKNYLDRLGHMFFQGPFDDFTPKTVERINALVRWNNRNLEPDTMAMLSHMLKCQLRPFVVGKSPDTEHRLPRI